MRRQRLHGRQKMARIAIGTMVVIPMRPVSAQQPTATAGRAAAPDGASRTGGSVYGSWGRTGVQRGDDWATTTRRDGGQRTRDAASVRSSGRVGSFRPSGGMRAGDGRRR